MYEGELPDSVFNAWVRLRQAWEASGSSLVIISFPNIFLRIDWGRESM
jgi:hypothetical protein